MSMTKEEVEQLLAESDAKNDLKIQMMMAASVANIKMTRKNRIDQEKQSFLGPDPQEEAVGWAGGLQTCKALPLSLAYWEIL